MATMLNLRQNSVEVFKYFLKQISWNGTSAKMNGTFLTLASATIPALTRSTFSSSSTEFCIRGHRSNFRVRVKTNLFRRS